jgi:hypothetical protein|tara:strand:+ start:396 stop:512 length:117 start_codon:yes stop_codon:yes gene_type:complete
MSRKTDARCWNCQKRIKVDSDNNNIYTRICRRCERGIK